MLVALATIFYRSYFSNYASVIVAINDDGFSPDKITISSGTTVTWVSGGEHLHWPASNFHPTHTLYPEPGGCIGSKLDACRGLAKGETFSFKFDKVGIWSMHDHLFPGSTMIVKVVDKLSANEKETFDKDKVVSNEEFRKLDYGSQMETIKSMATRDPAKAWIYVKDNFIVNGQVVGNAHEFAHIVGNKAFDKFGLDGVKICDEVLAFGCFHGVTEKMLLTQGLKNIKSIEGGCLETFPPDKGQNYTGCIHGIGHGVYSFEGGNMKKALADCDIISEPNRQFCYDGVFMENSFTPQSRIFDEKDPWKFCTSLNERYHRNCARYQSQIFLGTGSSNSLNSVGKNCDLGPSALLRETCFESLGYYIAQNSLGKVPEILKSCKQMPSEEGTELCINGAATENVFQKYAGFEDSANELCKSLAEPERSTCLDNIKNMLTQYVKTNE